MCLGCRNSRSPESRNKNVPETTHVLTWLLAHQLVGGYFRPSPVPLMAAFAFAGGVILAGANPLVTIVLPLISPALLCTPPLIPGAGPGVLAAPRGMV